MKVFHEKTASNFSMRFATGTGHEIFVSDQCPGYFFADKKRFPTGTERSDSFLVPPTEKNHR